MNMNAKLRQGTVDWFEMVGTLMCEAALQAGLAPDLSLSLVECYTDGGDRQMAMCQPGGAYCLACGKNVVCRPDEVG